MSQTAVAADSATIKYSMIFENETGPFHHKTGTTKVDRGAYIATLQKMVAANNEGTPSEIDLIRNGKMVARYLSPRQATLDALPDGDWQIQPDGVLITTEGVSRVHPWHTEGLYELL